MSRTITRKIIVPMAGIVLAAAFAAAWALPWSRAAYWQEDTRNDVNIAEANLVDTLTLTQDQLVARVNSEMKVFQSEARRLGLGSRGRTIRIGTQAAPDLLFGGVSQTRLQELVEPTGVMQDGAIFSLRGGDFIRLASAAFRPDGSAAVGSALDPASPAYRTLIKGWSYWGPSTLFGELHFTDYEPIRDAAGTMIGAFGIEYPLDKLSRVALSVRRVKLLRRGFLALVDPDGQPLFPGGPFPAAALRDLLDRGRLKGETWVVARQAFAPWGVTILAAYPMQDISREIWTIRWGALAVALLLMGALTLSYYLVLRRNLLQPLNDVLGVLGMISFYKQYRIRFDARSEGEVGVLTGALNGMLDQIQARDSQLLEYQEHLEDLVAQRLEQLLQAKQLLSATLDALPVYIAITEGEGAILVTNRQWDQGTGSSNQLMAGAKVGEDYRAVCRAVAPEETASRRIAEAVLRVIAGDLPSVSLDYDLEMDGQRQWFAFLATRFSTQGSPRIVLMHVNVTEKRRMEIQLRQAQKLESIGQLASGIAHEINTPTQYIGDNTIFLREAFQDLWATLEPLQRLQEAMDHGTCPPAVLEAARQAADHADLDLLRVEVPRAFEECLEGIRRVSSIVSAMKDFSHPGSTSKIPTDLNRAIESTTLVCRSEWKYVADLALDLDPDLPPVACLPDEFNQVILNLIINAAHAISDVLKAGGGGRGLIKVTTRRAGDSAQIRITDSGTGIPEAIRSRIFDPFFTTKGVGKGTGQGLAIAYAVIVEHHGGSITLETEMGQGTTFSLRLPFEATPTPLGSEPHAPQPQANLQPEAP